MRLRNGATKGSLSAPREGWGSGGLWWSSGGLGHRKKLYKYLNTPAGGTQKQTVQIQTKPITKQNQLQNKTKTNYKTNKQTNKQNKHTNKQTNKQTNTITQQNQLQNKHNYTTKSITQQNTSSMNVTDECEVSAENACLQIKTNRNKLYK
jgi:hypothetical protein